MLGVSRQTLYALLDERTRVSVEMALRLGTLVGNGPQYWLDMQSQFDMWQAQAKVHVELKKIKPLSFKPLIDLQGRRSEMQRKQPSE